MNLEDFIPTYPLEDDPLIQTKITNKYEFLEKYAKVKEDEPKRGDPYQHQECLLRYMRFHDRILLMDHTGTGKSCKFLLIAR